MFTVNEQSGAISLNAGDTGAVTFHGELEGHTWGADDRVLVSIKSPTGDIVHQDTYDLVSGETNGDYTVVFYNATTDEWPSGSYQYECRYIVNPAWRDGVPVDGDVVVTPEGMPRQLTILPVIGKI